MPPKHISWGDSYIVQTDKNLTAELQELQDNLRIELKVGEFDEKSAAAQLAANEAAIFTPRRQETEENKTMGKMVLHFNILVKECVADMVDIDRLKSLWPGYQYNIHIVDNSVGFIYNTMIKAQVFENHRKIVGVSRGVTGDDEMVAGTFNDAIDFVMEELLKRINKTQYTNFSRQVSSIDPFFRIGIGKNSYKQYIDIPELKRVHSSGPVSVAIWSNGKKSMVRRQKGDKADPEKGILYAVIKGLCYEKGGTKEYSRVLDMIHEALEERKNG